MKIETLTERQRVLLVSQQLPSDEHIRAGVAAIFVISAQAERIASLERQVKELNRECNEHVRDWSECQGRLDSATARAEAADLRAQSWERGHDYAWSEKRRAEEKVAALEARLAQLEAQSDSDAAHLRVTLRERDKARASALQVHGLDPAEIEVYEMFDEPATLPCVECKSPTSNWHQTNLSAPRMYLCLGCERLGYDQPEAE